MINIVIPMAGAGSRFANAGFKDPKPLIKINDIPMIKIVIDNLKPKQDHKFIFICQKDHIKKYGLYEFLKTCAPSCEIIEIDGLTEGAACTVLKARDLMTIDPICIEKNQLAYKAIQIMEKNRKKPVSVLPVLDSKKQMCGIIRLHDLIQEGF